MEAVRLLERLGTAGCEVHITHEPWKRLDPPWTCILKLKGEGHVVRRHPPRSFILEVLEGALDNLEEEMWT